MRSLSGHDSIHLGLLADELLATDVDGHSGNVACEWQIAGNSTHIEEIVWNTLAMKPYDGLDRSRSETRFDIEGPESRTRYPLALRVLISEENNRPTRDDQYSDHVPDDPDLKQWMTEENRNQQ